MLNKQAPSEVAKHANNIVTKLENDDVLVRRVVIETLGKLDQAELAKYVDKIVEKLKDPSWRMRKEALHTLGKLNREILHQYADKIVDMLKDEDPSVRRAALNTLNKLDIQTLTQHADKIVANLDNDKDVQEFAAKTLIGLSNETINSHVLDICAKLKDSNIGVHREVIERLGKLDEDTLNENVKNAEQYVNDASASLLQIQKELKEMNQAYNKYEELKNEYKSFHESQKQRLKDTSQQIIFDEHSYAKKNMTSDEYKLYTDRDKIKAKENEIKTTLEEKSRVLKIMNMAIPSKRNEELDKLVKKFQDEEKEKIENLIKSKESEIADKKRIIALIHPNIDASKLDNFRYDINIPFDNIHIPKETSKKRLMFNKKRQNIINKGTLFRFNSFQLTAPFDILPENEPIKFQVMNDDAILFYYGEIIGECKLIETFFKCLNEDKLTFHETINKYNSYNNQDAKTDGTFSERIRKGCRLEQLWTLIGGQLNNRELDSLQDNSKESIISQVEKCKPPIPYDYELQYVALFLKKEDIDKLEIKLLGTRAQYYQDIPLYCCYDYVKGLSFLNKDLNKDLINGLVINKTLNDSIYQPALSLLQKVCLAGISMEDLFNLTYEKKKSFNDNFFKKIGSEYYALNKHFAYLETKKKKLEIEQMKSSKKKQIIPEDVETLNKIYLDIQDIKFKMANINWGWSLDSDKYYFTEKNIQEIDTFIIKGNRLNIQKSIAKSLLGDEYDLIVKKYDGMKLIQEMKIFIDKEYTKFKKDNKKNDSTQTIDIKFEIQSPLEKENLRKKFIKDFLTRYNFDLWESKKINFTIEDISQRSGEQTGGYSSLSKQLTIKNKNKIKKINKKNKRSIKKNNNIIQKGGVGDDTSLNQFIFKIEFPEDLEGNISKTIRSDPRRLISNKEYEINKYPEIPFLFGSPTPRNDPADPAGATDVFGNAYRPNVQGDPLQSGLDGARRPRENHYGYQARPVEGIPVGNPVENPDDQDSDNESVYSKLSGRPVKEGDIPPRRPQPSPPPSAPGSVVDTESSESVDGLNKKIKVLEDKLKNFEKYYLDPDKNVLRDKNQINLKIAIDKYGNPIIINNGIEPPAWLADLFNRFPPTNLTNSAGQEQPAVDAGKEANENVEIESAEKEVALAQSDLEKLSNSQGAAAANDEANKKLQQEIEHAKKRLENAKKRLEKAKGEQVAEEGVEQPAVVEQEMAPPTEKERVAAQEEQPAAQEGAAVERAEEEQPAAQEGAAVERAEAERAAAERAEMEGAAVERAREAERAAAENAAERANVAAERAEEEQPAAATKLQNERLAAPAVINKGGADEAKSAAVAAKQLNLIENNKTKSKSKTKKKKTNKTKKKKTNKTKKKKTNKTKNKKTNKTKNKRTNKIK